MTYGLFGSEKLCLPSSSSNIPFLFVLTTNRLFRIRSKELLEGKLQRKKSTMKLKMSRTPPMSWVKLMILAAMYKTRPLLYMIATNVALENPIAFCARGSRLVTPLFSSSAQIRHRPSARPSAHTFVRMPVCPPVRPSASPSVRPSVRPSVCPSVRSFLRPSVCPIVHPPPIVFPPDKTATFEDHLILHRIHFDQYLLL